MNQKTCTKCNSKKSIHNHDYCEVCLELVEYEMLIKKIPRKLIDKIENKLKKEFELLDLFVPMCKD